MKLISMLSMNDKELIKKVIPLLLDRNTKYPHIYFVSGESLAELFECSAHTLELESNITRFVNKYPEIFSLYGIKTVDNGYGKYLKYLDQPIHYRD